MKKVYLYKGFERFWHWAQTLLIFFLMLTGFEIHGSYQLFGYEFAVTWHNIAAWAFAVLIIFAIFWHLTTDAWRQYVPTKTNLKAQIDYYLSGIFKNAPHPVGKRTLSKLNPLQILVYLGLKILVIPVMVLSGFTYLYFNYPIPGLEFNSLELVAVIHTLGAYFLIVFVLVHVYLITTGHTVGSNLRAMVTGWDEMDDEEIKDIVEEAIEETGLKIKSMVKGQDEKEVKQLVMEALDGAKDKVEHNKLKGQF
jgi:thiosulfate reductase cytochrome b subunit